MTQTKLPPKNSGRFNATVANYRQALIDAGASNVNAKVEAYRIDLEQRLRSDLQKAEDDRDALNAAIPGLLVAITTANNALTTAEDALENASIANDWTNCTAPQSGPGTVYCQEMYNTYCRMTYTSPYGGSSYVRDVRDFILAQRLEIFDSSSGWSINNPCNPNLLWLTQDASCRLPFYYAVWLEFQRADEAYRIAVENLAQVDKNITLLQGMNFSNCVSGSDVVFLWSSNDARELLRRVDRRAVLQ